MIEMKSEAYINKIIESTGLTRKEIQELVENKKVELKGLISDEGALFIIARELGVDVKEESKDLLNDIEINIADITQNMKNITLFGRIKEIYNVNSFNRTDGGLGYVGSFLLHDNTGDIRVVLWDDHVKIFQDNNFGKNELVKIINGNAKKGKYNNVELHIGRFGRIILSPDDVDYNKYPKIKDELINISNINLNLRSVSLEGKVVLSTPLKEFTRKDGTLGKVRSLTLLDPTGSIRITFWNEDTTKLNDINIGDVISITSLNPKLSNLDSKTIDLTASRNSMIKKQSKEIQLEIDILDNVSMLQDQRGIVSFKGIIISIDDLKNITLKSGENVSLLGFVVSDDTDWIKVTIWREKAEEFSNKLSVGQGLLLKNVLVRYNNFSNRNEITLISESILESIELEIKDLKSIESAEKHFETKFTGNYVKIGSINAPGIVELKGFIAKELSNITIYEACTNCFKKVENCTCDKRENTEFRMIINLIIDDGSDTIRTTFIGEKAEKLIGLSTDKILQIKETNDFEKFLEKKSSEFLGKDIIIRGRVKFSDFSNSFEISAFDFKDLNIEEELERVIKEIET